MPTGELIVLGCGPSECVPLVTCLARKTPSPCAVCASAHRDPAGSRNTRRNCGAVLRVPDPARPHALRTILIDCGKTFYEASKQWFPLYGVDSVDAVVLTHDHADHTFGIDDLRDWTLRGANDGQGGTIPVYARQCDLESLARTMPWVFHAGDSTGSGLCAQFEFCAWPEAGGAPQPLTLFGVQVVPLPVLHGRLTGYMANGYRFGDVCWVSDAVEVPASTRERMRGCRVLFIDAVRPGDGVSAVVRRYLERNECVGDSAADGADDARAPRAHMTMPMALAEVQRVAPRERAYLVGMNHEGDYRAVNEMLCRWRRERKRQPEQRCERRGCDADVDGGVAVGTDAPAAVEMAWDGMRVAFHYEQCG